MCPHHDPPALHLIQGGQQPADTKHPSGQRTNDCDPSGTVARVKAADPAVALPAIRLIGEWLREAEADAVTQASADGWTQHQISEALGRSNETSW
jgi:hypothetical protein